MEWPTFIAFVVILINIMLLSYRLAKLHIDVHRLDAKLSFLTFVRSGYLQGKTDAEMRDMINKMSEEARAELAFAEIARRESKPWWRKVV